MQPSHAGIWREAENKWSSCSDDSKYRALILGRLEQQFKIKSCFWIFVPVIGEVKCYDDESSHAIKFIYELFGNISFLYWMKSFLYLCKGWVDA